MDKSTHIPNAKEFTATPVRVKDLMVQDRETGEWYDPQERFEKLMAREDILAVMKRMKEK